MKNYSVFRDAEFPLSTTPDRPIVLITANNGGGKTSTLSAFRLALHGRRSFDVPLSEKEYSVTIASRFHAGNFAKPCEIELDFDYLELNRTRSVQLRRSWRGSEQRISEEVTLLVDGEKIANAEADDFLSSIVPPEVARYFFFDAERIKEMAAWESDDETQLFDAVEDLLGIQLLGQLSRDLQRLQENEASHAVQFRDLADQIREAATLEAAARETLKIQRLNSRSLRGAYDRAITRFRRLGGTVAEELNSKRERLATIQAEHRALTEEAQRSAHDILPLICGRTLRKTLGSELERRRLVDDREIVSNFLTNHRVSIDQELQSRGLSVNVRRTLFAVLDETAHGKPVSVGSSLPNLSRTEESWMQRVVERELPSIEARISEVLERLKALEIERSTLESAIRSAPNGDSKGDAAIRELETAQRALLMHEEHVAALETAFEKAKEAHEAFLKQERLQRVAAFQSRRLVKREEMICKVLEAIPDLQERLQYSKQRRFGTYLFEALGLLWHKQDRLSDVRVSFKNRSVDLIASTGLVSKVDLSSAEKQLFATGFIYSLSRLSGKHMPFVIDTPVGRLDREHRKRFIVNFLPEASHQTILLSTDTEIVGSLYDAVKPFIAHHHDLSDYNGTVTQPVQLASA